MILNDNSGKKTIRNVRCGQNVKIGDFVNLYDCTIGTGTKIGPFVEIQKGVNIGRNCKISSHSFICEGVSIGDGVFIGHGVSFTNDRYPRAVNEEGEMITTEWNMDQTVIEDRVSIGTGATIRGGKTGKRSSSRGRSCRSKKCGCRCDGSGKSGSSRLTDAPFCITGRIMNMAGEKI